MQWCSFKNLYFGLIQIYRRIVRIVSCCMSFLSNATQYHHEAFISSRSEHITADTVFPRVFKNYFGISHPCKLSCSLSVLWAVTVSVFPHLSWFFWRFKKHPSICVWHFSDNYSSLVTFWGDTWSFLNMWQRCTWDPDDTRVSSDSYLMTWVSQCLTGWFHHWAPSCSSSHSILWKRFVKSSFLSRHREGTVQFHPFPRGEPTVNTRNSVNKTGCFLNLFIQSSFI